MTESHIPLPTPFRAEMEVEARFTIPRNPREVKANALRLMNNDSSRINDDVMIRCRVDKDQLQLISRKDGTWLHDGKVIIPYPGLGASGNVVTLRVQARSDHFFVTINGDGGHKYPYQLPYTDVNMLRVKSGLEYYTVRFPHL